MIIPDSDQKASVNPPHHDEERPSLTQSPPPYTSLPQVSSANPTGPLPPPPDLAPTNYLHVREKSTPVKLKVLLDLNLPPPPASALPVGAAEEEIPHLVMDSHERHVSGEVWVLRANHRDVAHGGRKPERVRLQFHSHNGSVKARVHLHPLTFEPRPFLSIEARGHNCYGPITIMIPRSFRGQLTLQTDNGRVHLSPALAPRAATLSTLNGTHTYFVGERPNCGKWHTGTGTSEDGDEVDEVIGITHCGPVRVFYDDEQLPGVLSSFFKALGF